MNTPGWLADMANPSQPHIVAEGADQGAIVYLPPAEGARAVRAGSHISLVGRDMTTFDLDEEKARRPTRRPAAPATEAQADQKTTEPPAERVARVGRYANRSMVTKPGERN